MEQLTACVVGQEPAVPNLLRDEGFVVTEIPTTIVDRATTTHQERLQKYVEWVTALDRADVVVVVVGLDDHAVFRLAWATGYAYRAEKPIITFDGTGLQPWLELTHIESALAHVTDLDALTDCIRLLKPTLGVRPVNDALAHAIMEVRAKYQLPYVG